MGEDGRKNAILTMYEAQDARSKVEKTFICLGVARGGTSAVAGVMQRLGLFMGDDLPNNYEDKNFIARPPAHMKETIAQRNAAHPVWGWKAPNAANYLEGLLPVLRNPHLVVVFRDIAATMKAHVRWHNRDHVFAAQELLLQQQKNWFLIERWRVPTALVSYEKAILAPELFVRQMADFLDVPPPDETALPAFANFLHPGSYK